MQGEHRQRLDAILGGADDGGNFDDFFDNAPIAPDDEPLPPGRYRCLVANGELARSKVRQTPSYKLSLDVLDPPAYAGRRVWHDLWLTPRAIVRSKRDLAKLRIHTAAQLHQAPPTGLVVEVTLAVRTGDDGTAFNRVTAFKVVEEGTPPGALDPDDDDPDDDGEGDTRDRGGFDWRTGEQGEKPKR
ncbi:MAG: hypothetical protein KatS3mg108_1014 [Isosphaeraceae bacterium]|jgi:hypothetical protein|nr:MAG: hypothetical protein KatS3mg108_1014 [Isosphaeraceae bacterium]